MQEVWIYNINEKIMLSPITLKFLEAVKINNNTERMHKNHDLYVQERKRFTELVENLIIDMQKIDPNLNWIIAKDCIYRFNKDLRFSPDKSHPYKLHFWAFLCSWGRKSSLPWYYIHIQPWDNSMIGWWSWCPSKDEVNRIRLHIWRHWDEWKEIIENPSFKKYYGRVEWKDNVIAERRLKCKTWRDLLESAWEKLARKVVNDAEMIEILRYVARTVSHNISDETVLSEKWYNEVISWFKTMKDFNDFLLRWF